MEPITNEFGQFWVGPFETRVPWNVEEVPAEDGINSLFKQNCGDGKYNTAETELYGNKDACYSATEFQEIYCERYNDGFYYWIPEKVATAKRTKTIDQSTLFAGDPNW